MDEVGESTVEEFDYRGQHITITQIYGAGYSFYASNGTYGSNFPDAKEAEMAARKVLDDQASRWLEKAVQGE